MRFDLMNYGLLLLSLAACTADQSWHLVDNFEAPESVANWTVIDAQNETEPFLPSPQIAARIEETGNTYLLSKPAPDGVVGNRKALSFTPLPFPIKAGETATLYTRINVEYFPNNQSFGLSNVTPEEVETLAYDAFEPMIRVTDKAESDGSKNDGTITVLSGYKTYSKIQNPKTGEAAKPLVTDIWYEVWAVINNGSPDEGGQSYDLYIKGGEFDTQEKVFENAVFRMGRAEDLGLFITISNTGPKRAPYGNGGVRYDDIYIAKGQVLTRPF